MSVLNPFRPTAGATPPQLIGRDGVLDEFRYGLNIRSGAPGLLTIITGARGIGKTVMLNEAEDAALRKGWVVISETATRGFLERIGEEVRQYLQEYADKTPSRRITGIGVAGVSINTQVNPEVEQGWRQQTERLLRLLDENQTGLLITLDEIHGADRDELSQLAAWVQHFIREALPISLIFAGLPAAVSDLLNEGVATFLRRADRIDLQAVPIDEVQKSYQETFAALPVAISDEIYAKAAEATGGYPFMIQVVGYHLWQVAEGLDMPLTLADAQLAIDAAKRRNARVVIEAALATVSAKDQEFLKAMAQDESASRTADLATRLNAKKNTIGNYRARLIDAGLIEPAGYGLVDFTLPGLREYLRLNP